VFGVALSAGRASQADRAARMRAGYFFRSRASQSFTAPSAFAMAS
jgi:hypothetical protein